MLNITSYVVLLFGLVSTLATWLYFGRRNKYVWTLEERYYECSDVMVSDCIGVFSSLQSLEDWLFGAVPGVDIDPPLCGGTYWFAGLRWRVDDTMPKELIFYDRHGYPIDYQPDYIPKSANGGECCGRKASDMVIEQENTKSGK